LDDTPLIVKELRDAGLSMQDALEIWQQGFRCVHEGVRPPIPAEAADVAFEDYIREKLHLLKRKLTSGKVENITGFLLEAIRKNFANPEFVQEQKHQKAAAVQRVRKEQEARLKKLKAQLVEKKEARDKALDDTYGEMAQTFPEVLEAALPSIFADNLFLHQCYDPDKPPLENYQASFMFKEAFRPYLECHAPERIQAVQTQYATEIAALEEHIAALQVV